MDKKTIEEYVLEIRKFENQISELNRQLDEIKKKLSNENTVFEQLQKEKEVILKEIKLLGFFNFKKKKPHKKKLKENRKIFKNREIAIYGLKVKDESLSKQINDLQNELKPIQQAKEDKEKEEKWINDLRTGNISCDAELDKIGIELQKCFEDINLYMEKYNLFSEWNKYADAYGTSSPQANSIWNEARSRYYCSPLEALRNHKTIEYPTSLVEKLELIREVNNNTRVNAMINDFEKIKTALNEIFLFQLRVRNPY